MHSQPARGRSTSTSKPAGSLNSTGIRVISHRPNRASCQHDSGASAAVQFEPLTNGRHRLWATMPHFGAPPVPGSGADPPSPSGRLGPGPPPLPPRPAEPGPPRPPHRHSLSVTTRTGSDTAEGRKGKRAMPPQRTLVTGSHLMRFLFLNHLFPILFFSI